MKQLIIILMLSFTASAQLEVNTQKDSILYERTGLVASNLLSIYYWEDVDEFSIHFLNAEYQHITVVEHISIGSEENLRQFCQLVRQSCETKEIFETSLYHIKRFSKKAARIWTPDGWFYIYIKDIEQIENNLNK